MASTAPERLCQIENTAPGRAAAGEMYCAARPAARPEFCMPTSIETVRATGVGSRNSFAAP